MSMSEHLYFWLLYLLHHNLITAFALYEISGAVLGNINSNHCENDTVMPNRSPKTLELFILYINHRGDHGRIEHPAPEMVEILASLELDFATF